ncbi:ADP-ribosylglycohydrolase family protein [Rhodococcus aerolatus]
MRPEVLDRAAGALLGSAAGDALGAGYEFTHPDPGTTIDMIGGGPFGFAPGEWTDDTSMAVAVARVVADGQDLRTPAALDAVAAGFDEWYAGGPKDIGNQTRAVLSQRPGSAAAMTAAAAGITGRTGGNGSLMRTAAVGLGYLEGSEDACADAAAAVSLLTHADERATQACRMWSVAVRHAVLTATFDGVRGYLATRPDEDAHWGPLLDTAEQGEPADFANNGWVVHALQTAWWAITRADAAGPEHLQAALELCVRAGHDTDTTAAIAGALLGARWGASAVPARWRRVLHGWPGLAARDLVALGVRAARGGADDREGWPSAPRVDYSRFDTGHVTTHPHDDGVLLGGVDAVDRDDHDVEVALCRMGSEVRDRERVEFWLVDADHANPNLEFVVDDAAATVRALRDEGKRVLLHCVEGRSRTPTVAARYAQLLGRDPADVLAAMPWARPREELWRSVVGAPEVAATPDRPRQVTIYDRDRLAVWARLLEDGQLQLEGQHLYDDGEDYEYFLTVRDVGKVVAALGGAPGDDVLTLLQAHGEDVVAHGETEWLRSRAISYETFTY